MSARFPLNIPAIRKHCNECATQGCHQFHDDLTDVLTYVYSLERELVNDRLRFLRMSDLWATVRAGEIERALADGRKAHARV